MNLDEITIAAKSNIPEGQFLLGFMYERGYGWFDKDIAQAYIWYRKAADANYAAAQYALSQLYAVQKNSAETIKWCARAAQQGYPLAQYRLAGYYKFGLGVEQNNEKLLEWLLKAADGGYLDAMSQLGFIYYHGYHDVTQDYKKAFYWFHKLAMSADKASAYQVARMHEEGYGVKKDYAKAFEWYTKAAELGSSGAHSTLSHWYSKGINGVPFDPEKSKKHQSLFEKSVESEIAYIDRLDKELP